VESPWRPSGFSGGIRSFFGSIQQCLVPAGAFQPTTRRNVLFSRTPLHEESIRASQTRDTDGVGFGHGRTPRDHLGEKRGMLDRAEPSTRRQGWRQHEKGETDMSARKLFASVVVVGSLAVSGLALAQFGGRMGRGGTGPTGPGEMRQPPDPAQMQHHSMNRVRETLQVGDEEWKALEPRLERVMVLSREAASFGPGDMSRGPRGEAGPRPGPGMGPRDSAMARAARDLRTALDNTQTSPSEISAKLTALRAARAEAERELAKARESVREVVTQRQEAHLVLMGVLD